MKHPIFTLAMTSIIAGTMITSCNSSAKKVENAQIKVEQTETDAEVAYNNLRKEQKDSVDEAQKFKSEANERIIAQQKSIIILKERIAKKKAKNHIESEKRLAELEILNTNLKKELDEYKNETKWTIFKSKFQREMDQLGEDIQELTKKN
jgi:hypothetical protein